MQKETIQIAAYTPPPNGTVTVDGAVVHTYESFQTIERYREYRDCGFTEILFAGEDKYTGELFKTSKLKKMLDMAADTDLKAVVFDERLLSLTVNAKQSILQEFFGGDKQKFYAYVRECMREYAEHSAFYGISVLDEPKYDKRNVFAELCAAMHAVYPKCFVMTCLLPCIQDQGLAENAFGTGVSDRWGAYRRYLAAFASSLGYVHYDCYPFGFWEGKNVVAHKFIRNMQEAALTAKTCGVPFHMTVQSFSSGEHDELRHLDGQDLSWQTDLALGFNRPGRTPQHVQNSPGRVQKPEKHLHRGRLSGAVRPQQTDHFTGFNGERDVIHRLRFRAAPEIPEHLGEPNGPYD